MIRSTLPPKSRVASACPVSCTSTTRSRSGASQGALQNHSAATTRTARRSNRPGARPRRGRREIGTKKGPELRTSRAVLLFHRWLARMPLHSTGPGYFPELPDSVLPGELEPPVPVEELLLLCFFLLLCVVLLVPEPPLPVVL